ncbi:MAG: CHAT domain-containing protein [Saccharothrix sp.]|nr:CHAT domain-containing protein [Saccharothrix sp.]
MAADFRRTGELLHSLVFRAEVARCWREAAEEPLRTYLLVEPEELRAIPWETMKYRNGGTLFTSTQRPFARVDGFPEARGPGGDADPFLPIRVLVVEGERDREIGTATEVRAIKQALSATNGRIEAEFLKAPTRQELIDAYRRSRPQVFHFIGHTTWDAAAKAPALRLRDDARDEDQTVTPDLLGYLRPAPRVAVLNACRSARTAGEVRALAGAFFTDEPGVAGAAAVIGMQGDVRGSAAARFGGEFYRALARGMTVDVAVAAARAEVYARSGVVGNDGDWFLPVLTVRGDAERALRHRVALSRQDATTVDLTLTELIGHFVDRTEERRLMVENLAPAGDDDPARLVVVHGDKSSGKSNFLHWLRRWCALRGQRVKYVDLREGTTLDYARALDAIRVTAEDIPSLTPPADPAAIRPDVVFEPVTHRDDGPPPHVIQEFGRFFEELRVAVDDTPLVLILDHVDGVVATDFRSYIHPLLINRVVRGELLGLRLVVAMDRSQSGTHWPAAHSRPTRQWIDVGLLDPADFRELAEDALLHFEGDLTDVELGNLDRFALATEKAWAPSKLADLISLMRDGRRRAS